MNTVIEELYESFSTCTVHLMKDEHLQSVFKDIAAGKSVTLDDLPPDYRCAEEVSDVFYFGPNLRLFSEQSY